MSQHLLPCADECSYGTHSEDFKDSANFVNTFERVDFSKFLLGYVFMGAINLSATFVNRLINEVGWLLSNT